MNLWCLFKGSQSQVLSTHFLPTPGLCCSFSLRLNRLLGRHPLALRESARRVPALLGEVGPLFRGGSAVLKVQWLLSASGGCFRWFGGWGWFPDKPSTRTKGSNPQTTNANHQLGYLKTSNMQIAQTPLLCSMLARRAFLILQVSGMSLPNIWRAHPSVVKCASPTLTIPCLRFLA